MAHVPIVSLNTMTEFVKHRQRLSEDHAKILKAYCLEAMWSLFVNNNRAASLYYHNNYHAMWMMVNCYNMSMNHEMDDNDRRLLLIAAMFHDFDHSGGVLLDKVNIAAARTGVYRHVDINDIDKKVVIYLIKITEFPFAYEPITIQEKIIRDSDIMQGMTPFVNKIIYHDLFCELLTRTPTLTYERFIALQREFHEKSVMYTPEGLKCKEEFVTTYGRAFMDILVSNT